METVCVYFLNLKKEEFITRPFIYMQLLYLVLNKTDGAPRLFRAECPSQSYGIEFCGGKKELCENAYNYIQSYKISKFPIY